MKRSLLVFFIAIGFFPFASNAQVQRYIYLWDVTLSMKGYQGKTPDIYDNVVSFLEQEINQINSNDAEIVVLPFQTNILEVWEVTANSKGKAEMIRNIKNYNNSEVTNTNIAEPFRDVMEKYVKDGCKNNLYILTDGKQSGGNKSLLAAIKDWGENAVKKNAFAYYVMLTNAASDIDVINTIENTPDMGIIKESFWLEPESNVTYNIVSDSGKTLRIGIKDKEGKKLPMGILVEVVSDGVNVINGKMVEVENDNIAVKINQEVAKTLLADKLKEKITLRISLSNDEELRQKGKIVSIIQTPVILELIKNPEKKLTIYYE